jgi:hypothetical protein
VQPDTKAIGFGFHPGLTMPSFRLSLLISDMTAGQRFPLAVMANLDSVVNSTTRAIEMFLDLSLDTLLSPVRSP